MSSTLSLLHCITLFTTFLATGLVLSEEKWEPLFNGKDLTGWTPKIRYEAYGEDSRNTFRVEDGLLKVRYDNYEEFNETFDS